jgi:Guanylate-binding protein, N-terminal domain
MESKKGIQLIKFKSNGEIELSIEGIQLLQSLPAPLGIVSIIGPPSTGKSALCNKILGVTHGLDGKTTSGIWAWSETLKVIKRDEDGTEYKGDILVIDCEAVVARLDKNKTRGLEILTLACLISSHIVYLSDQPFHTQTIQDLDIFGELPNLINVRKHIDSFKSLYEYMPVLTWVILGPDIKAPEDTARY